jgi:hypothetical protein
MKKKDSDAAQDAKVMKNMTPAQMVAFKKGDKKMDKDKTMSRSEDTAKDKTLAKKVKKEVPAKKKKAEKKK